jgi:spermidine/putrescine transport system ATP-binding protein
MKKERIANSLEGKMVDATHVEIMGTEFVCAEQQSIEGGEDVIVEVDFDKVELMDNKEDGTMVGDVRFILYKGDHYHLTVRISHREYIWVDTNDIWDKGDLVGINIAPKDIKITKCND